MKLDFNEKFYLKTPKILHIGTPVNKNRLYKLLPENSEGAVYRIEKNECFYLNCKYVKHNKIDGKYLGINNEDLYNFDITKFKEIISKKRDLNERKK